MKIKYVNFKNEFPRSVAVRAWFSFDRFFSGKVWHISIKHHTLVIDLRREFFGGSARD